MENIVKISNKQLIELKLRRCGSNTLFEMVMINELMKYYNEKFPK